MTGPQFVALLPWTVLGATATLLLLYVSLARHHASTAALTVVGLVAAFALLPVAALADTPAVTPLFRVDRFALYYTGVLIAAATAVAVLAYGYLRDRESHPEEFYVLLVAATAGAAVLAAADHFASFFLGLELLSVSLYALIAYPRSSAAAVEAGMKYLVLAAVSSAFLLFGMALVYAELGSMQFEQIAQVVAGFPGSVPATLTLLAGLALLVVGIGYKLALVPFHMWAPDVYEGAPLPATAFVATVSKGGVVAVLLRFFTLIDFRQYGVLFAVFAVVAVGSMVGGNLLALLQSNVKRILAYSSVAHLGYLMVAFVASGGQALTAVAFYLAVYVAASLGAFGVMTLLSGAEGREADRVDDYAHLFWRHPGLAAAMTASLFSLAGIPLTAGFVGKFYLVLAGAQSALWWLVVVLVLSSVIGLFYYLRIIVAMFREVPAGESDAPRRPAPALAGSLALVVVIGVVMWLGVYPSPFIHVVRALAATL